MPFIPDTTDRFDPLLNELRELGAAAIEPAEFWRHLLDALGRLAGAEAALLLRAPTGDPAWRMMAGWPAGEVRPEQVASLFGPSVQTLAEEAAAAGRAGTPLDRAASVVAVRIDIPDEGQRVAAILRLPTARPEERDRVVRELRLAAGVAGLYAENRSAVQARAEAGAYREVLETVTAVYGRDRFVASCFTFCNELARRFGCEQVSLGFLVDRRYVRLQVISRSARFDRRSALVRALEGVMEEAADQQEEVIWPAPAGTACITRQHEQYARQNGLAQVVCIPLRKGAEVVAVVCCERVAGALSDTQVRQVSLAGELLAERLEDLRRRDRWAVVRAWNGLRRGLSKLVGVEHTWAKVAGIAVAAGLAALAFGRATYRIEAPFRVKASVMAELSSPVDGFVEKVSYEVGDRVKAGQELIAFDRRALQMERLSAMADLQRYQREAEKRWAEDRLADMRINEALIEQTKARLELVGYRLEQSVIRAPFDGVVVAGEWKQKINASVRQGERLLTVAQLDRLYAEIEIGGADIARVREDMPVRIAFASDPRVRYPVRISRIQPAAAAGPAGPVFAARAEFEGASRDWWRPGMNGVAKIDAGVRPLWWMFGHRTMDVLRLKWWW